jgi:hypothetical protein
MDDEAGAAGLDGASAGDAKEPKSPNPLLDGFF